MKIAITGAGGFIGTALRDHYMASGQHVLSLSRESMAMPESQIISLLEGTDLLINLAGVPILGRWTRARKKAIYDSRILTTRKLASVLHAMKSPPDLFLSGSAVGIYCNVGIQTENKGEYARDFLGKLCQDWEAEAIKATDVTRVVVVRTGVVLGKDRGALSKMIPLFRAGLGGVIASGSQGFSWVHIKDVVEIFDFLATHSELSGAVNMTSPQPLDNRTFTKVLASVMGKRALFPVPAWVLKLAYGEGAKVLTEGQFVLPEKLMGEGFSFGFTDIEQTLKELLIS